jgi:hypothetical protein
MNKETVGMRITDIPMEFYSSATRQIINFGIGIVKVAENVNSEDAILIGSGTLIDFNGSHSILTAQHVIDALPTKGNIGFVISEKLHKYVLDAQSLSTIKIDRGNNPESGPDLGVINLPHPTIGSIKALKSFYNVGNKRERMLENPPENDLGVWCIWTKSEKPQKGFDQVKAYLEFCGFGGISNEYDLGEYDYFDFEVHYNDRTDSPISFGGVSGGGLWQVIIGQKPGGELVVKEVILSGIAFFQTELIENKRTIKCHGRKSIYGNVFEKMKKGS